MSKNMSEQLDENRLHIFYIHSNITQILTLAVIKYKQIPDQQIIILHNRNHNLDSEITEKYKIYNFNIFEELERNATNSYLTQVLNFMSLISDGNDYELYLPHISRYTWKTLVLHCNCVALNYIEEGSMSYLKFAASEEQRRNNGNYKFFNDKKAYMFGVKDINEYIDRAIVSEDKSRLAMLIDNIKFYAISDQAFPFANTERINVIEYIEKEHIQASLPNNGIDKVILLGDSFHCKTEYDQIYRQNFDIFFNKVKQYLDTLIEYELYIQFHPDTMEIHLELWEEKLNELKLSPNVIQINLEYEFIQQKDTLHLFSVMSSALYYAQVFSDKHKSYAFSKTLFNEPVIKEKWASIDMSSNDNIDQTGAFSKIVYY